MHMKVDGVGTCSFLMTTIYASPQITVHRNLWSYLHQIVKTINSPWIVGGDFNVLLYPHEKSRGSPRRVGSCNQFWKFIEDCQMRDIVFIVPKFTWGRGTVQERLDRFICNDKWYDINPGSMVKHLDKINSDHHPILMCLNQQNQLPQCK